MKNTLNDLYIQELRSLFSAEMQLVDILAKISESTGSAILKQAITGHLNETIDQLNRLEDIFRFHRLNPRGEHCAIIEWLATECRDLVHEGVEQDRQDSEMILIAQKAGHYEIASYATAKAYAALLGEREAEELLHLSLDEERQMERKLHYFAACFVNRGSLVAA